MQGRNLEAGTGAEAVDGHLSLVYSAWLSLFSIEPRTTSRGREGPHMKWAEPFPPHQPLIKEMPIAISYGSVFTIEVFPF